MRSVFAMAMAGLANANYRSGEVKTNETFTYGRFTVRMQGSGKPGTVGSFFMYWNGPNHTSEGWNEIDVELVPSIYGNPMSTNIIWQWQQQDQQYCWGFQPGTDWHTYVIEWTPEYVSWSIDGNQCRRTEHTDDVHFLTKAQNIMMNFWTPTFQGWGNDFRDWGMPFYTRYDYVTVETYNHSTGGFDLHWHDDFDHFDSSRWFKSDGWGFGSNSSTFYASQVYTENGNLVLKMDH